MPRNHPSKRHRKPLGSLPRQRIQKTISQPRLLAREEILRQLSDSIAACNELLRGHGEGCDCDPCRVTSCMIGSLHAFRLLLEIS